jgi:hypothetical protein
MHEHCVRQTATQRELCPDCAEHEMGSGIHRCDARSLFFKRSYRGRGSSTFRKKRNEGASVGATHKRQGRPRTLTIHEPLQSPFSGRNSHSFFFFFFSSFPSMEALFFSSQETLVNCFSSFSPFSRFSAFRFSPKHDEKNTLSTNYMSSVFLVFF